MKKGKGFALTSAIMLVVAMLGVSFATSLTLSSPHAPSFSAYARCSPASASVNVTAGSAQVVVPPECESQDIRLYVGSGNVAHSVEVESGEPVSLPAGFVNPQGALVTANTWPLPTSLDVDQPPVVDDAPFVCTVPQGECIVEDLTIKSWSDNWPDIDAYNAGGRITTTSPTKQEWTLTINLSSPDFPFVAGGVHDTQKGLVHLGDSGCSTTPRTITVKGTTAWGDHNYVWAGGKARNFQINGDLHAKPGKTYSLLKCP